MADLTWKEFKEKIDKQLKEKNISEDTRIQYIDISFPRKDEDIEIRYDDACGICIFPW
jgi:predicted nucleic acid-binding protein